MTDQNQAKNAAHKPAHETKTAAIHSYDRTQLHSCIDEACPHRGYIVHCLDMFAATWMDDTGQIHNHCELKLLPKPKRTKTPRALQIRATELDGTRTRTFLTKAGNKRLEAIQARAREQQRLDSIGDLPPWMLKPCYHGQIPNDCLQSLDKCPEAKFCFMQCLAAKVKTQ
jgi:hypothetical protein